MDSMVLAGRQPSVWRVVFLYHPRSLLTCQSCQLRIEWIGHVPGSLRWKCGHFPGIVKDGPLQLTSRFWWQWNNLCCLAVSMLLVVSILSCGGRIGLFQCVMACSFFQMTRCRLCSGPYLGFWWISRFMSSCWASTQGVSIELVLSSKIHLIRYKLVGTHCSVASVLKLSCPWCPAVFFQISFV